MVLAGEAPHTNLTFTHPDGSTEELRGADFPRSEDYEESNASRAIRVLLRWPPPPSLDEQP
jgi:hypothetical protein